MSAEAPERERRAGGRGEGRGERAMVPKAKPRSYYGHPIIKEPVWTWEIPSYFFAGGLAGASAGLAYLSELRGRDRLARRSWAISLAGLAVSPALLVSDLGRPERFLGMLRVLKVTSPMSVGSWLLAATSAATGVAATNALTGRFPRGARLARPAAALLGLPLSTYTAALLANTAVPAWHEARRTLPFAFAGGAAASAGAAATALTPPPHAGPARRLAVLGAALETGATQLMEHRLGDVGEPYRQGAAGRLARVGKALTVGGAALVAAGRESRALAGAGSALVLAGAASARWSVFKAGFQSAADPAYTAGPQRRRIEAGRSRGASRAAGRTATTS